MVFSSSFTVGLLHALHAQNSHVVSPARLAEEACHIEIDVLREPIGSRTNTLPLSGGFSSSSSSRTVASTSIR